MNLFDDIGGDLRYAVRTLRREPSLVAGVVFTFALAASTMSYPDFLAIASSTGAVREAAAFQADRVTIGRGSELNAVPAVKATGQYFSLLGVHPRLGRFFGPADDVRRSWLGWCRHGAPSGWIR